MTRRTVTTQVGLDAALDEGVKFVVIDSSPLYPLCIVDQKSSTVRIEGYSSVSIDNQVEATAYGNATVWAYRNARVKAGGDTTVHAQDRVQVEACGNATVWAYNSSRVDAQDQSRVYARDWSTVRARGDTRIVASGDATVVAHDNVAVEASGNVTVRASGYSTVRAYDAATVVAHDNVAVEASSRVAVHLHSTRASVAGGVVIDHTAGEPLDPAAWCAWHGVPVTDGVATLYKAVNESWTTRRGVNYAPGQSPSAPDWRDDHECGGGLHFSPRPIQALIHHQKATRFVAVGVQVAELRPIPDIPGHAKAKAPRVVTPCREVGIDGKDLS